MTSQKLVSLQMRLVLVCVQQECPYALQQTSVIRTPSLSRVMVAMKSALLGRPWYSALTALDTARFQNFCQQQVRHAWVKGSFTVKPWMSAQILQSHFCVKLVRTASLSARIPTSVCPIWHNVVGSRGTTVRSCMNTSERYELPNIAPVVQTGLIYLETIASFDADAIYSDDGHVIGLILGNGTHPGVDSQGEELSIAIVETSQVPDSTGEWQYYALCNNNHSDLATACSSVVNTWVTIGDVSEARALILPNTARIRFIRKVIEFDGAVWMRVKLWDGNPDGYLSPADNLVRMSDPHFDITVPFRSVSPYSEATTLIVQPLIIPPSLQFSDVQEDVRFVENRGNTIAGIVVSIQLPNFRVLPEDRIEGFPAVLDGDFASYEADVSLHNYFNQVCTVNPTRLERQDAVQSRLYPGVGVSFDATSSLTGTWQVTSTGDSRRFIYLDGLCHQY